MNPQDLKPNIIVRGPMFPEPVKVIRVVPMGGSIKLVGQGMNTGLVHQPILSPAQLANLEGTTQSLSRSVRKIGSRSAAPAHCPRVAAPSAESPRFQPVALAAMDGISSRSA